MYLTDILIQNVGPIENLDLRMPFNEDGSPKITIFVGANGSGKTVLQSSIADALILMATPHFSDIVPQIGLGKAYFKVCGSVNQRIGTPYGLSLLAFEHDGQRASYVDKSGVLSPASVDKPIHPRFPNATWPEKENAKVFTGFNDDQASAICRASALCFFPSSRRELPHWLNTQVVNEIPDHAPSLNDTDHFANLLGKPIFIERCRVENKQWILDVLFDSRAELEIHGDKIQVAPYDNLHDRILFTTARNNINLILRAILNDPTVRIHSNYRERGPRLAIARGSDIIVPSLDGLSLGQSLLFNLFCTIARYADKFDVNKGHQLNQIEGVVIIDEVDAHLHTELQFTSLPRLIKLFPRVQFIISTHAPMFLLGMEKEFGVHKMAVFEMPQGDQISTERFSEFQRSLDHYRDTKTFEDIVRNNVLASTKPTVLLEGDTDRDYLIEYLNTLNRTDLLSLLNIDWVGNNVGGSAQSGGKGSLDTVAKTFKTKLDLLNQKLLLIYDCDSKKPSETLGDKLFIRCIPQNPCNTKFQRGIENLLPESLAMPDFYDSRIDDKYGELIQKLNKRRLCNWVIDQKDSSIFASFKPLLDILEEFASSFAVTEIELVPDPKETPKKCVPPVGTEPA